MTETNVTQLGPLVSKHLKRQLEQAKFSAFSIGGNGQVLSREGFLFAELEVEHIASDVLFFLDGLEDIVDELSSGRLNSFKLPNVRMITPGCRERDYAFELASGGLEDPAFFVIYAWDVTEVAAYQQDTVHRHNSASLDNERLEKEKANAEELARTQSHFLANISHELRTPLTLALGNCDLLRDQTVYLDENARNSCLTDIRDNAEELLGFVSDLLDYSSAEADKLKVIDETVDLGAEIERLCLQFHRQALELGLSLNSELPTVSLKIRGERRRIRQILTNLLTNALKYTPKGGSVVIGADNISDDLVFFVKDNGQGMSQEEVSQIGQPFLKFEKQPLNNHLASNGLGLALTKKLVEAHGGRFTVASNPGEGTSVTVILPTERRL